MTRREIELLDAELLRAFEGEDPQVRPGGGESRLEIRRRVRGVAAEWAARLPGGTLRFVAHLGVVRALLPGLEADNARVYESRFAEMQASWVEHSVGPSFAR